MKKNILIVDDEPGIVDVVREGLTMKNYGVYTALGVDAALEILYHNKIDLVVTDIAMPGKNGFNLIEDMKSVKTLKKIPVIMLTGLKTKEMVRKGLKLGVYDYLIKPV